MQVEIMMALEEKFDINIDANGTENIAKVEDVAVLVQKIVRTSLKPGLLCSVVSARSDPAPALRAGHCRRVSQNLLTCSFQAS